MGDQKHGGLCPIREFSRHLVGFCEETEHQVNQLRSRLGALGTSTWTDQNHHTYHGKFEESAGQLLRTIQAFREEQSIRLDQLAQQYEDVIY